MLGMLMAQGKPAMIAFNKVCDYYELLAPAIVDIAAGSQLLHLIRQKPCFLEDFPSDGISQAFAELNRAARQVPFAWKNGIILRPPDKEELAIAFN